MHTFGLKRYVYTFGLTMPRVSLFQRRTNRGLLLNVGRMMHV